MLDWIFNISEVMGEFFNYLLQQIVSGLSELFTMMDNNTSNLFELSWISAIVNFFYKFGWAMFVVGFILAVFEFVMEKQTGKGTFKDIGLNLLKGFIAVSLFTRIPIELYKFSVTLQSSLTNNIINIYSGEQSKSIGSIGMGVINNIEASLGIGVIMLILLIIVIAYAIIKVFLFNLKRGGILLILVAVGSLYMFSVPRGYVDGFTSWCKQVIALCLTTFLQTLMLTVGLLTFNSNLFIGLGLILSATEVPRIAGHYGLDTSTKSNLGSSMYAINSSIGLSRNVGMLFRR